jgi:hypothetical protein
MYMYVYMYVFVCDHFLPGRPRYCKTHVTVDHYKFVDGLTEYLQQRTRMYRTLKLHWWRDSKAFLDHISENDVSGWDVQLWNIYMTSSQYSELPF